MSKNCPTRAQISVFAHWKSMNLDMKYVKCSECPFQDLCNEQKEILCDEISRFIEIVQKRWGLKGVEPP